ncbi:MAG: tetratricopeptide repeat protein [Eubacterium sp.]|nr:tetratricopeptide repeat protein [Eubacterium sp.]
MRCPRCDANVTDTRTTCNFCGQDLSVIHYAVRVSNTYYNLGLQKAKVRDLSGATVILKKSLQFNKTNTDARNLLGLVYYEMGETVAALSEWILSKYFQEKDNLADYFLDTAQKNKTALDAINQTLKKYNAALSAAKAGNEDLAIIQLRKVVNLNPRFIRAQQLLGLLYIHSGDLQKAAKCLNKARKIDFTNTRTLCYLNEISQEVEKVRASSSPAKLVKKDPMANVKPVGSYSEEKKSMMPAVYTIIGAVIGIIVCFVLIRPTLTQSGLGGGSQIADANNEAAVQSSQISNLERQNESLTKEIESLKKKIADGDTQAQNNLKFYERLAKASRLYTDNDKVGAAVELAGLKKSNFTTDEAKALFAKISVISSTEIESLINRARDQVNVNAAASLSLMKKVIKLDGDNQRAMLWLGRSYELTGDKTKAKKWYKKAIKLGATTEAGGQARRYLDAM